MQKSIFPALQLLPVEQMLPVRSSSSSVSTGSGLDWYESMHYEPAEVPHSERRGSKQVPGKGHTTYDIPQSSQLNGGGHVSVCSIRERGRESIHAGERERIALAAAAAAKVSMALNTTVDHRKDSTEHWSINFRHPFPFHVGAKCIHPKAEAPQSSATFVLGKG
jgi:hypothetical protein